MTNKGINMKLTPIAKNEIGDRAVMATPNEQPIVTDENLGPLSYSCPSCGQVLLAHLSGSARFSGIVFKCLCGQYGEMPRREL